MALPVCGVFPWAPLRASGAASVEHWRTSFWFAVLGPNGLQLPIGRWRGPLVTRRMPPFASPSGGRFVGNPARRWSSGAPRMTHAEREASNQVGTSPPLTLRCAPSDAGAEVLGEPARPADELHRACLGPRAGQPPAGGAPAGQPGRPGGLWQDPPRHRSRASGRRSSRPGACSSWTCRACPTRGWCPAPSFEHWGCGRRPGQGPLETLIARLSERDVLVAARQLRAPRRCLRGAWPLPWPGSAQGCGCWLPHASALGSPGEAVVDVGGLELPRERGTRDEGWLQRSEAGRLFIDRARMARADFVAPRRRRPRRGEHLRAPRRHPVGPGDGSSPGAPYERRKPLPKGSRTGSACSLANGRAGPPRHRSLLASIEWSCGLLGEGERRLLHRLSVFASGFTLAAAEAVCAG